MATQTENFNYSCMGIGGLRRACRLLVSKRLPRIPVAFHNNIDPQEKIDFNTNHHKGHNHENRNKKTKNCAQNIDQQQNHHQNGENLFRPSPLVPISASEPTSPTGALTDGSFSPPLPATAATSPTRSWWKTAAAKTIDTSLAIGRWPIMYSNSHGTLLKPPPTEKKLACTLEDLCFGCVKKITIRRDVVTENRRIIQEEELLTIKVQPGWTTGTKITFEGMGNEIPGAHPADIVFVIEEKRHPVFSRDGDNLELAVEIPLVKALTERTLEIPLVGGQSTSLTLDDIVVYPGFQKIIQGQGMPLMGEQGKRGNLVLTFLIEFPDELSEEQRSDAHNILVDCFSDDEKDDKKNNEDDDDEDYYYDDDDRYDYYDITNINP